MVDEVRALDGDAYEKATCLLVGLTKKHAFDSGNRRMAYAATRLFLEANGEDVKAEPDPRVLIGIRVLPCRRVLHIYAGRKGILPFALFGALWLSR